MRYWIILAVFFLSAGHGYAQHMFDYGDIKSGRFAQKDVYGIRPMADGEHYTVLEDGRIVKYRYRTGEVAGVIFDGKEHSLMDFGGFPVTGYEFSPGQDKILISTTRYPVYRHSYISSHFIYDIPTGTLDKLSQYGAEQVPLFSPDGGRVAFVKNNNIWYAEIPSGMGGNGFKVKSVTTDGHENHIINGHTDWVYEEEFGFTRAFEFSPDGRYIAFLRFDESEVPEFFIGRFTGGLYPAPMVFKYPKAGERNSVVTLHVYDTQTGNTVDVDTGPETDQYIPYIGWNPAGQLYFYRLNRLQNHFELLVCGSDWIAEAIYEERDRKYIERPDGETITFLEKGDRFIVKSERSGYRHLYLHSAGKGVIDTLTRGNWEVLQLLEVTGDRAYYLSNEGSALRNNLYSVRFNGKGQKKLTDDKGWYSIAPSPGFKYFISRFSNTSTPRIVRLHDSSGKVIRTLEDNAELVKAIENRKVPKKEFFRINNGKGAQMNCWMIKPLDFDPAKQYPVMMYQYSGPGSQQVLDRWTLDWLDVLVQEGYIVVCVDGRGTGGRGADFRKLTYGNLGGPETEDQITAAKYLATQPYIDTKRIGIYGWSYGGFMALNCILKGADVFKMAIAVAPVTSWRFYDTIYTEIYNGLPQDNAWGYDENSPVNFAGNLKGKLLLIHGTADDNVHFQNAMAMTDALVKAGKQFDMMVYPDDNHGMNPTGRHHVMEKMVRYTLENL